MLKRCLILVSLFYCSFSYAMQFPATMKNAQKPPSEANCKFVPNFVSNIREFYENGEAELVMDFIDETMNKYEAEYEQERKRLIAQGKSKEAIRLSDKLSEATSCMMFIRSQQ